MIEILDSAILLCSYKYDYNKYIVSVLTKNHGKVSGFTKKSIGIPGSFCNIVWKARLIEHLGYINIDVTIGSNLTKFWNDMSKICTMNAILAAAKKFLPDNIPAPMTYLILKNILCKIHSAHYLDLMSEWDMHLGEQYLEIDMSNVRRDIQDIKKYVKKYHLLNTRAKLDLVSVISTLQINS